MKKIIYSLLFALSIFLFNTCESPQEPDIEPPIINYIEITSGDSTENIENINTINEIITIKVDAIDNDEIAEIWFAINDTIGAQRKVTSSPWEFNLGTSNYNDSSIITIRVVAKDASDNKTISDLYQLTVDNSTSYPNNLSILSIEYDLEKMTVSWEESTDDDFQKYNLLFSEGTNDYVNANIINSFYDKSITSHDIISFDPTIKNWFWIEIVDQANLKTTSLSKSNEINQQPSQIDPANLTVFYVNEDIDILNIAWFPSDDWDFKTYTLEHRFGYAGPDEWDTIWSSDIIEDSFYCSPCEDQGNTIQFTPSTENEIFNWFRMTVTNHWGQISYPTDFNDADLDGPPAASEIISIEYNINSMIVNWEETQEDLIEFKAYNLYHSTDSLIDMAELIYSTTDECRDFNISNECTGLCIWDNTNNICHNNSIMESSWSHQYNSDDTLYYPTHANWFWIEVEDQRGSKTIGQGKSNIIEQPPEIINITSLNSNIIDNEVIINITWEQSNDDDFAFYTLYTSDYNWASSSPIEIFNNINTNSFNDIVEDLDQTVDNWFWITTTDIWNLESTIGNGMMISQDPMPQAVNVTSVEYDTTQMTIFWNESFDSTFVSYQLYRANSLNGEYRYIDNSTITTQNDTSFNILYFDPTIENWFKIKTIDNLEQFSFGSAKSNAIDELPTTPFLNVINYDINNNQQQFTISWEENTDSDFKNYSLYESYNSNMSNSSIIQNFTDPDETSFTRTISDAELGYGDGLLFYQLAANDFWGQSSFSNISVGSNHIKFIKEYGSSNYDFIFSIISNNDSYTTAGIYDNEIWVFQTDYEGNIWYEETYDFESYQGIGESDKSLTPTSDGGYILTGYTRHLGTDEDAYLMKLNSNLQQSWTQFYCSYCGGDVSGDDNRNERGVSVIETSDGKFVFTGNVENLNGDGFFVWVVKTDNDGQIDWNSGVVDVVLPNSTLYDNTGYNLIEASDGNFIIIGNVDNVGNSTDLWINKLSSYDGTKMWDDKYFGGISIDEGYTIIETLDGNYLIAGTTRSNGNGGYDGWVIKVDIDGNKIENWDNTYGGSNDDKIYSVTESSDGSKLTFCGYSRSYNDQNDDIWIFQTDINGNELFNKTISGNLTDKGYGIKEASDGGFIISGISQSTNDNGNLQAVLIKTDPQGNTVNFE